MNKKKIAFYWCSSCGGCEESVIDLAEEILGVVEAADIVFWPVALDFKNRDMRALDDGAISATLINGSIRMDEQAEMARLLRKKSKLLIAHGSCAHLGGVYGLGNFFGRREVLSRSYLEVPTVKNPDGVFPQGQTVESEAIRQMFTREALLTSDWYQERLRTQQSVDRRLWKRHVAYLEAFLENPTRADDAQTLKIRDRLQEALRRLQQVDSEAYLESLQGTLGADPTILACPSVAAPSGGSRAVRKR